jgi:hypothetical protein
LQSLAEKFEECTDLSIAATRGYVADFETSSEWQLAQFAILFAATTM